jgi:gliding motility-associated-like protein
MQQFAAFSCYIWITTTLMTKNCFILKKLSFAVCLFFLLVNTHPLSAQGPASNARLKAISNKNDDLFGNQARYIQNIGQYGDTLAGYADLGRIVYGYEGLPMPVLFTPKAVLHLQKKQRYLTYEERASMIAAGMTRDERKKITAPAYAVISMEWLNANPAPEIIAIDQYTAYHTYGMLPKKAVAYKKIIYKDLYPGIDAEYSFTGADRPGYTFNLLVRPGADISRVQIRYGGDIQSITTDKEGNLVINSTLGGITQSAPFCYFQGEDSLATRQKAIYDIQQNLVEFKLPAAFSANRAFVIDPFVTNTGTLTGAEAGEAKDIDFDYNGNIFVAGGGDAATHKLAKYSPGGTLLWTFSGALTSPLWNFGGSYGGWVVEKGSGAVFLGQGLMSNGFSVIRINSAGVYDNYISSPNTNFTEDWKMTYSCNSGTPRILIAGGGGNANNELAIIDPPSVNPATSNLSGLSGGHNDISDIVVDPVTNEMYTIYSTPVNEPARDNYIFKHAPPYNAGTQIWRVNAGFATLREPYNRPYLSGLDNSSNTLAVNSNYLFYWDGVNLKTFSKATGTAVGATTSYPTLTKLLQGGIYADECNNVYIGFTNGSIKVLHFNGASFDDAAVADISIAGFTGNVYDLVYDNGQQLLYVAGSGFVGSLDVSATCPSTIYTIDLTEDCAARSIQAALNPAPPTGSSVLYELYDAAGVLISSNSTGFFTGLTIGAMYTIEVFINRQCGGTHATRDFIFYDSPDLVATNPAAVCPVVGLTDLTDPAVTAGSAPGYTYSYWHDMPATLPVTIPTAVSAGTYYIKATPASGVCYIIKKVVVPARNSPIADAGRDTTICFGKNIQLNGANGVSYTWTPATFLDNPSAQNPIMINPSPGTYTYSLHVVDAAGCRSISPDVVVIKVDQPMRLALVRDTIVAMNQLLQLDAIDIDNNGFSSYVWTPSFGLNDPLIKNPIAILDRDMTYLVTASTPDDCKASASINVKVYLGPEIYVPTGFTPNNDGLNDIIKVVAVGMKEFHYFKIFNRWGGLVFSTATPHIGWDGRIKAVVQDSGVFVWMAEAIDFNGKLVRRKGTLTLIR